MQKVVVIRPGALGDTILTLPALNALRTAFPNAHVTFVGDPAWVSLLAAGPYVNATFSFAAVALAPLFASYDPAAHLPDWLSKLDLAVIWLHDHATVADNLRRLGARLVVAAPSRPPAGERRHVADYLLDTLAPVVPRQAAFDRRPRLSLRPPDVALAQAFWQQQSLAERPVAAIHPGSGGRAKCWPAVRFAAVADHLASQDYQVLVVSGPADAVVTRDLLRACRTAKPVCATDLELRRLAVLLARCSIFVGNDSGISHLAAAVGTPALAIYGPTDPAIWGIRGDRVALVKGAAIDDVSVSEVNSRVAQLLDQSPPPDRPPSSNSSIVN